MPQQGQDPVQGEVLKARATANPVHTASQARYHEKASMEILSTIPASGKENKRPLQEFIMQQGATGIVDPKDLRTGGSWKTLEHPRTPEDSSVPLDTYLKSHVTIECKPDEASLPNTKTDADNDELIYRFTKDSPQKKTSVQQSMQPALRVHQPSKPKPLRPDQIRDQMRGLSSSPSRNLEDLIGLVIESTPPSTDKPSRSTSPRWGHKTHQECPQELAPGYSYANSDAMWNRFEKAGAEDTTANSSSQLYDQLTPPSEEIAGPLSTSGGHDYIVSDTLKGLPSGTLNLKSQLGDLAMGNRSQPTPQPETNLHISKWISTAKHDRKGFVPSAGGKDVQKPPTEQAAPPQGPSEQAGSIRVDSSKSAACYSTVNKKSGEKSGGKLDKHLDQVVAKEFIISGLHSQMSQIRTCAPFVTDADTAKFWAPSLFSNHLNSVEANLSSLVDALLQGKIRLENMKELVNLVTNLQEGDFPGAYSTVQKGLYVRMKEDKMNILPWMVRFSSWTFDETAVTDT